MKSLLQSKTFWVAVLQALAGIVAVFYSSYPAVGELLVAKSALDVILRVVTSTAIGTKNV